MPVTHFCRKAAYCAASIRLNMVSLIRSIRSVCPPASSLRPPVSSSGLSGNSTTGSTPNGFGRGHGSPGTSRGVQPVCGGQVLAPEPSDTYLYNACGV